MNKAHDDSYNNYWLNYPEITTPIIAEQLNRIESNIDTIDNRVVSFDTTKANETDLLASVGTKGHSGVSVVPISLDPATGKLTVRLNNGTSYEIDTALEKVVTNFTYISDPTDPHYECLELTLEDGSKQYVDLSALITQYEFTNTTTVAFTVAADGTVTANVPDGSITSAKLQPNYLADCQAAQTGAEAAEDNAEAWADGNKEGVPVGSTAPQYHNNAKYYSDTMADLLDGLEYTQINIASTDWEQNYDPAKYGDYPYLCRKVVSTAPPSNPMWRMSGANGIPVGNEIKSAQFVLEAWFGEGEKYYTTSSTYTNTTAETILLYATTQPTVNLVLEYKGV